MKAAMAMWRMALEWPMGKQGVPFTPQQVVGVRRVSATERSPLATPSLSTYPLSPIYQASIKYFSLSSTVLHPEVEKLTKSDNNFISPRTIAAAQIGFLFLKALYLSFQMH